MSDIEKEFELAFNPFEKDEQEIKKLEEQKKMEEIKQKEEEANKFFLNMLKDKNKIKTTKKKKLKIMKITMIQMRTI